MPMPKFKSQSDSRAVPSSWSILLSVFCREALRALWRYKLRSSLTTLGITIGIAAVVLVIAIGKAGAERTEVELAKLGDNLVWIEAGSRNVAGTRTGSHGTNTLTLADAEAIAREVPLISRVSPQVDGTVQVQFGNRNWSTRFRGVSPDYLAIRRWDVASGVTFSHEDLVQSSAKVLLGETVRARLFGAADPVGQIVRIKGQLFLVNGVLAAKGQSTDGRDQDDWIVLPYTSAQKRLISRSITWLDDIFCSAVSPQAVDRAIAQVVALLRQRHQIRDGEEGDFNIRRPDEILKAQVESAKTLSIFLVSVASIALLVGGIGIMNVMLASVLQQTREIGLRMAIGASPVAVRVQFLGEAAALSLIGGVLGMGTSVVSSYGFARLLGWPIDIPASAFVLAIGSSVAVGLFFGLYPAWRASRLEPIEALRYE